MKEIKLVWKEDKYYIYFKNYFVWKKYDYYYRLEDADKAYESLIQQEGKPQVLKEHKF